MKIITRAVLDWDGNVLEEDSYEYSGSIAQAKSSGSSPQPVDPYQQAAAQYGLDTGTANYNAALTRTDSSNPLGSNTWNITGYDGSGQGGIPGTNSGFSSAGPASGGGSPQLGNYYGLGGSNGYFGGAELPGGGSLPSSTGSMGMGGSGTGAPIYSQQTSLSPWANQMLQSPIDTSNIVGVPGGQAPVNIPGMPGGPNVSQNDYLAQQANYNQQMGYLQPQEALQTEQQNSQLANEGITPGSAAYGQAQDQLGRQQTFANQQAADSAIGAGNQEEATLYGLGSQSLQNQMALGSNSLQNQLALRSAPISEYEALQGNPSGSVSAATPDISGAFNQQYQGQLAGYNANTATNNANTQSAVGLGGSALMAYAVLGAAF
jgi:hypothetical protein